MRKELCDAVTSQTRANTLLIATCVPTCANERVVVRVILQIVNVCQS